LADKVRVLRNYGSRVRYHNEVTGYNSRIDELQAAFLRVKLRHLDEWNARRLTIAQQYLNQLSGLRSQLFSVSGFQLLPTVPSWASPVWHLFVIRHPQRDALQKHLAEQGIQTIIHYPIPPHLSGAYCSLLPPVSCSLAPGRWHLPIAEQLANEVLSLPIGPHVTSEQVSRVTSAIRSFGGITESLSSAL